MCSLTIVQLCREHPDRTVLSSGSYIPSRHLHRDVRMADPPIENLNLGNAPAEGAPRKKFTFKKRDPVEAARLEAERQQQATGKSVRCFAFILQHLDALLCYQRQHEHRVFSGFTVRTVVCSR
jgi:hypothetical protein